MEPAVLFKGVYHDCGVGPASYTYGRIAAEELETKQAVQLLGIPERLGVYVQETNELWPGEEGEGQIFEVAVITACMKAFPLYLSPEVLDIYLKELRCRGRWEVEEPTHPDLKVVIPL